MLFSSLPYFNSKMTLFTFSYNVFVLPHYHFCDINYAVCFFNYCMYLLSTRDLCDLYHTVFFVVSIIK